MQAIFSFLWNADKYTTEIKEINIKQKEKRKK